MVPTPLRLHATTNLPHSSRLIVLLYNLVSRHVLSSFLPAPSSPLPFNSTRTSSHNLLTRSSTPEPHDIKFIVFACLIPILVILSGVFAGLTLGYMSLDETQLNVLSISGTP